MELKEYPTYLYHLNSDCIEKCSSGGAFFAISQYFISIGGVVYGAAIDTNTGNIKHLRAETSIELEHLYGSKYAFSNIGNCFKQCKDDLVNGKKVLFSGTPCQIGFLLNFLKDTKKDNLTTVDVICHGCPPAKEWRKYLSSLKIKPPYNIKFRYKKCGWENFYIKFNDIEEEFSKNRYMRLFLSNRILMPQCYNCKYKGDNHTADITLGDAWGVKNYSPNDYYHDGTSLIILRKNIGCLLNHLNECGCLTKTNMEIAVQNNPHFYISAIKPNIIEVLKHKIKLTIVKLYEFFFDFIYMVNPKGKVGIISDFHYWNFGNKLQGYALREVLKKNGLKSFIFTNSKIKHYPFKFLRLRDRLNWYNFGKKEDKIFRCSIKYEGRPFIYKSRFCSIHKINNSLGLIYGSDQIWNYGYNMCNLEFNLGYFDDFLLTVPRCSYAASVGHNSIPNSLAQKFVSCLSHFESVSVREKIIADNLTRLGIKTSFVLDPAFLLSRAEWEKAIKKYSRIRVPNRDYTFVYLLSGNRDYAEDCLVVNCMNPSSKYFAINQFDFIKLILNANKIITDSYHCIIFSLLFNKKFVITEREDGSEMNVRFVDLFNCFGINLEFNKCYDEQTINKNECFINLLEESLKFLNNFANLCKKK